MKSNEKKLVALAGLLFLVVLVVRIVPVMKESYNDGLEEIDFMEQRIQRLRYLIEEAPFIVDEEALKRQEFAAMEAWVFTGQDPNLIGSSVQRQLRQAVDGADLIVRQYSTPRFAETEGWLVVTQEMDFVIEQENILEFLRLIEEARPKLHITEFNINRNRRQYTGSITVTGFSKTI